MCYVRPIRQQNLINFTDHSLFDLIQLQGLWNTSKIVCIQSTVCNDTSKYQNDVQCIGLGDCMQKSREAMELGSALIRISNETKLARLLPDRDLQCCLFPMSVV